MDDMVVLRHNQPEIAEFLESWRGKNERRTFDFSNERDQADFVEAVQDMARHIAHVSVNATLTTVTSVDGVNTVYLNVTPPTDSSPED